MKRYIFGSRNGIYIIDLQQTLSKFREAYEFICNTTARGEKILFVGTKKQAQEIVSSEALRSQQFYVNQRWLGGMLTNFTTIKKSLDRLREFEHLLVAVLWDCLPNK
jgi:small subunit ribosomal protein S2